MAHLARRRLLSLPQNSSRIFSAWFSTAGKREKVAVIGSGNWGSVAARIVGQNAARNRQFDEKVKVWVFEEHLPLNEVELKQAFGAFDSRKDGRVSVQEIEKVGSYVGLDLTAQEAKDAQNNLNQKKDGKFDFPALKNWAQQTGRLGASRKLTDLINKHHENVKYLPGAKFGPNVIAEPDLFKAVEGATMLVFVTPHQFVKGICQKLKGKLPQGAKAVSLVKGMEVTPQGFDLISSLISKELGIDCSVLMGANIANEIAEEKFSEATIGYSNAKSAELWKQVFHTPYFHVRTVEDVVGPELCGTLKNIVALGAGFVDGLALGNNTKAAIIRIGLLEMMGLGKELFPAVKTETFFESCGVADLITTCFGGRNRKCAEAFVKASGKKDWSDLEKELLGGQKLQGVLTSLEVQEILHKHNLEKKFPLLTTINRIVTKKIAPQQIVNFAELP